MSDERRHPPTARRRAEALRSGRVPHSPLLMRAVVAALAAVGIWASASVLAGAAKRLMRSALALPEVARSPLTSAVSADLPQRSVLVETSGWLREVAGVLAAVAALCVVAYVLVHGVQTGGRLRRSAGHRGTLMGRCRAGLAQALSGLIYAGLMVAYAWSSFPDAETSPLWLLEWLGRVVTAAIVLWCVLGVLDYVLAWRRFEASLWMTTAELREEIRRERSARQPAGSASAGAADGIRSV